MLKVNHTLNYKIKLLLICTFFPYVGFKFLPSDIQPYALIFAIFLLGTKKNIAYLKDHYLLFIPIIISATGFIFDTSNPTLWMRSFTGYCSFLILSLAYFNIGRDHPFPKNFFKKIIYVWVLFALIQILFSKTFGSFLVANFRFGEERGILSLAPEPSYLGMTGFYLSIISYTYLKDRKLFLLCLFLTIVSQSVFTFIVSFLYFIPVLYKEYKRNFILGLAFTIPLISVYIFNLLSDRLLRILQVLLSNPFNFFYVDASSSDRVFHVIYSFKGFLNNLGIPNGYNSWENYALSEFYQSEFIWISTGRIMSTYGSILFETGIFGIPLIIFIINRSLKIGGIKDYPAFISLNFSLLFATPLALPIIPLILHLKYFRKTEI